MDPKVVEGLKKLADVVAHIATFLEEHPELAQLAVQALQVAASKGALP